MNRTDWKPFHSQTNVPVAFINLTTVIPCIADNMITQIFDRLLVSRTEQSKRKKTLWIIMAAAISSKGEISYYLICFNFAAQITRVHIRLYLWAHY
jgi:hypothetical protein